VPYQQIPCWQEQEGSEHLTREAWGCVVLETGRAALGMELGSLCTPLAQSRLSWYKRREKQA